MNVNIIIPQTPRAVKREFAFHPPNAAFRIVPSFPRAQTLLPVYIRQAQTFRRRTIHDHIMTDQRFFASARNSIIPNRHGRRCAEGSEKRSDRARLTKTRPAAFMRRDAWGNAGRDGARLFPPRLKRRLQSRQYTLSSVNTGMALNAVISSSKRTLLPLTGTMRLCPITVPQCRMTARFSES